MPGLPEDILRAVRTLARVNPLTPEIIAGSLAVQPLVESDRKRTLKALVSALTGFRVRGNLGKFRAALFLGVTLLGDEFLQQAERAGCLLANSVSPQPFGKFLAELATEVSNVKGPTWAALECRLASYINFQRLMESLARRKSDVSPFLRDRPRRLVKLALVLTEFAFLRHHFEFEVPKGYSALIDELGTPEEIASITSLLVVLANEHHPLESLDFALPTAAGLKMDDLRDLMVYGKGMLQQFEIGKYLSLFGYELEDIADTTFVLRPPSAEFEYFLRLGFIRSETNVGAVRADVESKHKGVVLSLRVAAERFAAAHRDRLTEIHNENTDWSRLRVNMPMIPALYREIRDGVFYEDVIVDEQLSTEFLLPLRYVDEEETSLTEHLDLKTFRGAWRYFEFFSLVDLALRRPFSQTNPTALLNSMLRVMEEGAATDFVAGLGLTREQAREFVMLISTDTREKTGYLDLQYRPALRIAQTWNPKDRRPTPPEVVFLPAVLATSNVARNLQAGNKLRFALNADSFVEMVSRTLKSHFPRIETNRPVKGPNGITDIDVVLLDGDTLFLFECKHSLPPTGPHELRDIWEDIEKAARQLENAGRILADPARRHSYLTGWFPGLKVRDTSDLKITACVLSSHRIFSGLHYRGFPIRDFGSLQRLCDGGIIGMGGAMGQEDEIIMRQYRILQGETLSGTDLRDYCSERPRFFEMFRPFMSPLSRIERLDGVTVARETFVYQLELSDWAEHMEWLGCTRELDRHVKLKPSSAGEAADSKET